MLKVMLRDQEMPGNYKFDSQVYTTRGFLNKFGDNAIIVVSETMRLIHKRAVKGADYLQVAEFDYTRYWIIDDIDHITFLLPEEY